jgi:hypothetical protein
MLSSSCGIKGLIKCNLRDPLWNLSWFRTGIRRMCVSLGCISAVWTLVFQSNNTTVPLHYFICILYIPYIQRTQDHGHCWICHVNWPNAIHISVCNLIHPIHFHHRNITFSKQFLGNTEKVTHIKGWSHTAATTQSFLFL